MYSVIKSTNFQDTFSKKSELKIQLKDKIIQLVTSEEAEEEDDDISFHTFPCVENSILPNLEFSTLPFNKNISNSSTKYAEQTSKLNQLPIWLSTRQLIL